MEKILYIILAMEFILSACVDNGILGSWNSEDTASMGWSSVDVVIVLAATNLSSIYMVWSCLASSENRYGHVIVSKIISATAIIQQTIYHR